MALETVKQMKQLREMVPAIDKNTELQKTIPIDAVEKYLSGEWDPVVKGYIARAEDVKHLKSYDEVLESLRLDYPNTKFVEGGDSYGIIRFKTNDPHELSVPYGHKLGGDDMSLAPATRNGFLASRNGDVIPEWMFSKNFKESPQNGAELYKVINGKEELVGIYTIDEKTQIGKFWRIGE